MVWSSKNEPQSYIGTVGVIKNFTFHLVKMIVMLHNYGSNKTNLRSCHFLKTIVFTAVNIVYTFVNIVLQLL